jgi:hypothetical protein
MDRDSRRTIMRTPIRPVPEPIARWVSRLLWLRGLDLVVAWAGLWATAARVPGLQAGTEAGMVSLVLLGLGLAIRPLRTHWRPITGAVGLAVSRHLLPGERAWYVRPRAVSLVLVTARHGIRLVIAGPDLAEDEGMSVRRTRVLLLPADDGRSQ